MEMHERIKLTGKGDVQMKLGIESNFITVEDHQTTRLKSVRNKDMPWDHKVIEKMTESSPHLLKRTLNENGLIFVIKRLNAVE